MADQVTHLPPAGLQTSHSNEDYPQNSPPTTLPHLIPTSGQTLPAIERDYFEPRFGHDFSRVRVHTDAHAAASAELLNARAYTLGSDVVFGPGQYAPGTGEGRRLLAHELAHVVQQGGGDPGPVIQRQLKVTGAKADIKAMLKLLGTASGLALTHDPKTTLVSAKVVQAKPPSPELAKTLQTIIDDPGRDAELSLGRKQEGFIFGAFPAKLDTPTQKIRIDQILALDKGAPGAGVAKLAHEIAENFTAHDLTALPENEAFDLAHQEGLRVENAVEREAGRPGDRRNTFQVGRKRGRKVILTDIEDRGQYFLVLDRIHGGSGALLNPRRVARLKVATHVLDGFTAKSTDVPQGAKRTLQALAADMKADPTASALVEGFAAAGKTVDENEQLALQWANWVEQKAIEEAGSPSRVNGTRFHVANHADKTRSQVVVTLERPDL